MRSTFISIAMISIMIIVGCEKSPELKLKVNVAMESDMQIIGSIRAGLETYAANQIVTAGTKTYPTPDKALLSEVLGEVPPGWSYTPGSAATGISNAGTITSGRTGPTITWKYWLKSPGKYVIDSQTAR